MFTFHRIAGVALVVLAVPAFAANVHCVPKEIIVTNDKAASIKVLSFKYKVATDGNTIFTEGLANKKLAANGEKETWKNQRLNHAPNGVVVTATAIEYKNDNSGAGDGYGPPQTSRWVTRTYACGDNHTYPHTITSQDP